MQVWIDKYWNEICLALQVIVGLFNFWVLGTMVRLKFEIHQSNLRVQEFSRKLLDACDARVREVQKSERDGDS